MLFAHPRLGDQERDVIERIDEIRQRLDYVLRSSPRRWTGLLRRATFARAIQQSNSIEGYNVSIEDAIAAAAGEEPLDAANEAWAAVVGYRNAMTYVLQLADDPDFTYSEGLLRSLHYMMLSYDLPKNPGRWRPGPIYVRREPSGEIVYEGPDAVMVPGLMRELIEVLNAQDEVETPVITRAAMAHLNLVAIHPFSDGNGRMARALQTLVLAREGILAPEFCSIEEYLGKNTPRYYAVLGEVGTSTWNPESDARPWIHFCLTAHYRQAMTLLRRSRETERMWGELEIEVTARRLPERVLLALADATVGLRVRSSTYRAAAEISAQVASRDLQMLVKQGLLRSQGEKRGRIYLASPRLQAIRERTKEPRTGFEDPFTEEGPYLPGLEPRPAPLLPRRPLIPLPSGERAG